MNQTIEKFGYPDSCIKEYKHWVVMLRAKQVTLGSIVLAEKSEATNLSEISEDAFKELKEISAKIEEALLKGFGANKLNYLMLMLVDPNVHYHVIPRYEKDVLFKGAVFKDIGWPKLPEMSYENNISIDDQSDLIARLKELMDA